MKTGLNYIRLQQTTPELSHANSCQLCYLLQFCNLNITQVQSLFIRLFLLAVRQFADKLICQVTD